MKMDFAGPTKQDKRSVVAIEFEDVDAWLFGTVDEAQKLARRFCRDSAMRPSMAGRPTSIRTPGGRSDSLQSKLGL